MDNLADGPLKAREGVSPFHALLRLCRGQHRDRDVRGVQRIPKFAGRGTLPRSGHGVSGTVARTAR